MRRPAQARSALLSITAHAAAIGLFLLFSLLHPPMVAPRHLPGTANGTHQLISYQVLGSPSGPAAAAQASSPSPPKPATTPKHESPLIAAPASAPSAPGNSNETGEGDGEISIALVQFHPRPEPDLSTLAPGASGTIVLDALIDAQGHIVRLSVDKSLGDPIDRQVIATVQQWTFMPATRNGTPIASEQEILFHYERRASAS